MKKNLSILFLFAAFMATTSAQTTIFYPSALDQTGGALSFIPPASGTFSNQLIMGAGVEASQFEITSLQQFTQGEYSWIYNFDHVLIGGTLILNNGWQIGDYKIELLGAVGANFASENIDYSWAGNVYTQGVDYAVDGLGTTALILDSTSDSAGGKYGGFTGFATLNSGSYSGIKLTTSFDEDADYPGTGGVGFDSRVYLYLEGFTQGSAVPEPSSMLLFGLSTLGVLLLRKR